MSNFEHKLLFFPSLTVYDYKGFEDTLNVMAAKGWSIESMGGFLWKFKRTEPSNKKFSVLFASSSAEDNILYTEKEELIREFYAKNGWEKECEWKQVKIYCIDQEKSTQEINETIRLENTHEIMKKTFIPNWIKLLLFTLFLSFSQGMNYFGVFPYGDNKTVWAFSSILYVAFIGVLILLGYFLWLKTSRKRISVGETCVRFTWYRRLLSVLLIGIFIFIVGFIY